MVIISVFIPRKKDQIIVFKKRKEKHKKQTKEIQNDINVYLGAGEAGGRAWGEAGAPVHQALRLSWYKN